MQDKSLPQSPFSPVLREIAEQCKIRPVTTAADFIRYPSPAETDTRRASSGLTEVDIESENLPYIDGHNNPKWMRHVSGTASVVKSHCRVNDQSAAAEWIFFMLGDSIGAAVPPAQIIERSLQDKTWYSSASFRAFPDSRSAPAVALIVADGSLPVISPVDQWMKHTERHDGHVVAGTVPGKERLAMAYVDNGQLDIMHDPSDYPSRTICLWPQSVREYIRESVLSCPVTQMAMQRIQETPDMFLRDIVHAVPAALFEGFSTQEKIIDGLKSRRDKIVPLMHRQLGLD